MKHCPVLISLVTNKVKENKQIVEFFRFYNRENQENFSIESCDWELLIRQARRANLLSRVAFLLRENNQLCLISERPRHHLESALRVYEANVRSVKWEISQIYSILHKDGIPFVLLKGAAYLIADVSAAKGRVFSDVDILVSKDTIEDAEKSLVHNGWITSNFNAYDQRYYRTWMHEIPPLRHLKRQSTLDVHHTILPPTSNLKLDPNKLWQKAHLVEGKEGLFILSLVDMILHSAAHLFHDGELEHGFRDITDLNLLFHEFEMKNGAWDGLISRARELDLGLSLYYAIRYTTKILYTPVLDNVYKEIQKESPGFLRNKLMDFLFMRALMPDHPSCDDHWTGFARWSLYIRSHYLRMPLHLLIPHLSRKAWLRLTGKEPH